MQDLATLPFLSDHRAVVVRDADKFITASRQALEAYLNHPHPTAVLILECQSFPKTTRLAKSALAAGGQLHECKKLSAKGLTEFILHQTAQLGKRIQPEAAACLIDLVGPDSGMLASEVEKLFLYVGDRSTITRRDVIDLVDQSREEKVFAALDAAAAGRLPESLRLWHQVLATDPGAAYRALGGAAFRIRQWLKAHQLAAQGADLPEIAPKVMMWGRHRDLQTILRRLPPTFLRRCLAALANLDSQAKVGLRSIDTGVELMLVWLASSAR